MRVRHSSSKKILVHVVKTLHHSYYYHARHTPVTWSESSGPVDRYTRTESPPACQLSVRFIEFYGRHTWLFHERYCACYIIEGGTIILENLILFTRS